MVPNDDDGVPLGCLVAPESCTRERRFGGVFCNASKEAKLELPWWGIRVAAFAKPSAKEEIYPGI